MDSGERLAGIDYYRSRNKIPFQNSTARIKMVSRAAAR
jgi:hypothetical protein